jgi:integrase
MGVKIRKRGGKWYVFVNYHRRRKAKCVGTSRESAEQVRRKLEAKLALGDLGFLSEAPVLTLRQYSETWLKQYAELELKQSTVDFYQDYQRRYVLPRFGEMKLTAITRDDIKSFAANLNTRGLARNTIRLAVAALRVVLSAAVEDGILNANPATKMGRFVQSHKTEHQAQAMEPQEAERFLMASKEYCPAYYALFLIALRAGLRQGEILALKWGDFQFGQSDSDPNRYILVGRRWYRGRVSTPKGNKARRVDMSRELRRVLINLRDERMLEAFQAGRLSISDDLLFPGEKANPVSVRSLVENYFLPSLERAGLRRFRFHDMRHTFGSLLIQAGAPLPYVLDQMGHSSIQITADKYVHLISGRNVGFVDQLDTPATRQQSATQAQLEADRGERSEKENQLQVVEGEAWCERGESNPHGFPRQILSLVRLPIPPLSH